MNIIDQDLRERFSQRLEKLSQIENVEGFACILLAFNEEDEAAISLVAAGRLSIANVCSNFADATHLLCKDMEEIRAQRKKIAAADKKGVQ